MSITGSNLCGILFPISPVNNSCTFCFCLFQLRTCRTLTGAKKVQEGLFRPDREWAPTGAPRRLRAKVAPAQVVKRNHQFQVTQHHTTTQNTSKINPALNLLRRFLAGVDQTHSLTMSWTTASFCSSFLWEYLERKYVKISIPKKITHYPERNIAHLRCGLAVFFQWS